MEYTVYILKSLKNGSYYIGQTEDVIKRVREHNSRKSRSTKFGIPWATVYKEACSSREESVRRERELKRIRKRQILEKIIALNRAG